MTGVQTCALPIYDVDDKTLMFCVKPANVEEVATRITGKARVIYSV